ncbi:MAG: ribonuclease H-like domain-containing protein [Thermoguttaceae bacterium]|nr:ribonuclease H-like domain-containing protein [Thermoguttaceae bacterium]
MLTFSFCGIGGLDQDAEETLWNQGVWTWMDYLRLRHSPFSESRHLQILKDLDEAERQLRREDFGVSWFFSKLPPAMRCRLLPYIRGRVLYLDIETTGLNDDDFTTLLTVSDGIDCQTYVRGLNLRDGIDRLLDARYVVTYNGDAFDLPFLCREFNLNFSPLSFDLRKILYGWGISRGLKRSMKTLGIKRKEIPFEELNGVDAVNLWNRYETGGGSALEILIRYNRDDVYALVDIFQKLYCRSMKKHLFFKPGVWLQHNIYAWR